MCFRLWVRVPLPAPCRSKARSVQAPAAQDEPPDILSAPPSLLEWAGCGPVLLRGKAG